ncbi:transcriptional regulator [Streptomyces avicenniae]|uniref:transcriptional regulator n=1 Tax=Streptomyces avicenniae TaxID=500153 RepID=UPI000ADB6BF2|nr:transcriptional regulator [Streptomyces avicenniae]
MSKNAFARAIAALAAERGHAQVRPDGSRVRRWIDNGERPRPPVPDLLAEILSQHTGYRLTVADLGLAAAPAPAEDEARYRGPSEILSDIHHTTSTQLAHGPHRAEQAEYEDEPQQAEPRHLLTALETWSWSAARPLPGVATAGRLGHTDAERIAAHTSALRQMDNSYGGASMLHMATAHLATTNTAIRHGTYTEQSGRALFRELGDLAGVVGWAAHDAAHYPQAVTYLTLAVHAARESGDRNLTAHLLQCLARVWGYIGHPQLARDCIALALYGARNTASPVLRAGLHALDARFAALLGLPRDAVRAIHHAQEIFAEDSPDPAPAFVSYLDEAELSSTCGEVLLFLARTTATPRHAQDAIGLLATAADHRAEHRVRSRTFDAIALARAQLFSGQVEAAHATAEQAVTIGAGLDSARVRRRYRDLAREAAAHPTIPHACELHELLTTQPWPTDG